MRLVFRNSRRLAINSFLFFLSLNTDVFSFHAPTGPIHGACIGVDVRTLKLYVNHPCLGLGYMHFTSNVVLTCHMM